LVRSSELALASTFFLKRSYRGNHNYGTIGLQSCGGDDQQVYATSTNGEARWKVVSRVFLTFDLG
jgi:hypothetical protein